MKINRCHHIALASKDTEQSIRFYETVFGGRAFHHFPIPAGEITLVDIGGDVVIEIIPKGTEQAEQNAKWAHLALEVDDCAAAYQEAVAGGAVSDQEPTRKQLGTLAAVNAFVKGPDGELIEFFEIV